MGALPPPLPIDNGGTKAILACSIIFPILSTLCVLGRIAARRIQKSRLGADDYLIIITLVAVYGHIVLIVLAVIYGGVGHHINGLSSANITVYFKILAAVPIVFGVSLGLAKISICLLLVRIFSTKSFKRAAWFTLGFSVCFMVLAVVISPANCKPFAFNWDKSIPGGKCDNLNAAYISIAAVDIVGDLMIIILPMPWLWKLQMPLESKIGLTFVFGLGFLDIIASILRIVYLERIDFNPPADTTWESTGGFLWSVVEPCMAIVIACIALLRPIFLPCFPTFRRLVNLPAKSTSNFTNGGRSHRHYSKQPGILVEHRIEIFSEDENGSQYPLEPLKLGGIEGV